jgi:hypothetical protein
MKAELKPTGKKLQHRDEYYLYVDGKTDRSGYTKKGLDFIGDVHRNAFAEKLLKLKTPDFPADASVNIDLKRFRLKGAIFNEQGIHVSWYKSVLHVSLFLSYNLPDINSAFNTDEWVLSHYLFKEDKKRIPKGLSILDTGDEPILTVVAGKNETIGEAGTRLMKLAVPFLQRGMDQLIQKSDKFANEFRRKFKTHYA